MSILINKNTRVLVQGITGKVGQFHTKNCIEYGTQIVAGVTPGKRGEKVEGVPVFDTVMEAVEQTGADATMIFVPSAFSQYTVTSARVWPPSTRRPVMIPRVMKGSLGHSTLVNFTSRRPPR